MKKQTIRAESFDLMQYFYRAAHDPIIRAVLEVSGRVDEAALKQAALLSCKAVPVIGCRFRLSAHRPRWEAREFSAEDFVFAEGPEEEGKSPECFLTSSIDIFKGPQLKIGLFRGRDSDTLCILINHMVCDGGGFKEYLYLLCGLYGRCLETEAPRIPPSGPRGAGQLLERFSPGQKIRLAFLKYDLSSQRQQAPPDFLSGGGDPFVETKRIPREGLEKMISAARANRATVNDMLLTAYARVLRRLTGEQRVVIPCPADLRKYLPAGKPHGICNLTTNYICGLTVPGSEPFPETLRRVSEQMRRQKSEDSCLKSILLVEAAFHLLPFRILQKNFSRLFTIPVLSYTNFGVLDKGRLRFGGLPVTDAFLTGAVKHVPYFQLAASTFDGTMTLSCNLYGTREDRRRIGNFLAEIAEEMGVSPLPAAQ